MSGTSTERSAHQLFSRTQFFSRRALTRRGAPLLLAVGALGAAFLGGCGGGGGNGNSGGGGTTGTSTGTTGTGPIQGNADISGKVTDTQGNGVPGASIVPDTGGSVTATLGQGGYRLNSLTGNVVHKITASVQQGNVQYTGSTQVYAQGGFLVSNANIVLSPIGRQATVSGTVQDTSGNGIGGVRVFLALPNNGNFSSLVAFTDANGAYSITNIPIDLPSSLPITLTASTTSAQNQTATLGTIQAGGVYSQNFTLSAASGTALAAPTVQFVFMDTEPTDSQSGRLEARVAGAAPTSIYERIHRALSPDYARVAGRTVAAGKRLQPRAAGAYAIETNLAFTPSTAGNISGFSVYRTTGTTAVIENTANAYDFLQDPLANYYHDVTFSTNQSTTAAGTQYNFALSATNTSGAQTGLSPTLSIIPLTALNFSAPTVGQVYVGPVTLTWNAVTGATKYYVFIYDQYPTFAGNPKPVVAIGTPLAAGTTSYTTTLLSGKDYYAVVVGASDQTEVPGQTPVTNAVMTFSQITRFHVQ